MAVLPPADQATLDEAVAIAREAGALTLRWFQAGELTVDRKDDGTPVTDADRAAERFVRAHLAARHPADTVVGEEEADVEGTSGRTWIVDPIDGTKAFTRGVPLYATLLAVLDEHGPAIGVIDLPALGRTVWAGRGLGCFLDGQRITVSERHEPAQSVLSTSSYSWWPDPALLAVKHAGYQMRTWGDGYGYALVATGRVAAMVDPIVEPYDVGPMPVVLAEAGGRFTDLAGHTSIEGGSGLGTNGQVHEELLALLTG
jgi:histidinol-phosphatase